MKVHCFNFYVRMLLFILPSVMYSTGMAANTPQQPTFKGLCYSPFRINESPDCGVYPTKEEIQRDLRFIRDSKITDRIRTYSCADTQGTIPNICNSLGIECWPGAWLSRYRGPTEREIQALIAVGKAKLPNVPVLIVGNEVLLRKDMDEPTLIRAIQRVKGETGLPVAYAEIGDVWLQHPKVAQAVDVMLVHLYPYWEGMPIDEAMPSLVDQWNKLVDAFPGKRIVIGETGWPSAGETTGGGGSGQNANASRESAVPSEKNAATYLKKFLEASRDNNIDYFYFSLFSESWKSKLEGIRGENWGLYTQNGTLKPLLADLVPVSAQSGMKRLPGAIPTPKLLNLPAFVYRNGMSAENHFFPTDWMGDTSDLSLDEYCSTNPHSNQECLRINYVAKGTNGWSGLYWVGPYMNHWGEYPGYVVKNAKEIEFWARGEKGGEEVHFKVGGIHSGKKFQDSFGPLQKNVKLSSRWEKYSIELTGKDTSSFLGGFCVTVNSNENQGNCAFCLDDIVIK